MDLSAQYQQVSGVYGRSDTLLVFPSEVAAAAWRRALAEAPDRGAVRSDRIISWDVFKERAVPVKRSEKPVGRLARRAFALRMLEQNAAAPFLSTLVSPEFAHGGAGSAGALTRMLPQLPYLVRHRRVLRSGLADDLEVTMEHYREFLAEHALFEPEWELSRAVDLTRIAGRPVVFYPELLEDYREYEPLLRGHIESVPLAGRDVIPARRFSSVQEEIGAALDRIEEALRTGTPGHRVAITAADLEGIRPWLEGEAARRGISLRFAAGSGVGGQSGARLFTHMREVIDSAFSVTAVAGLVLDHALPWNQRAFLRLLVQFGYRGHCYRDARWEEAFDLAHRILAEGTEREQGSVPVRASQLPIIRDRYRSLKRHLQAVRSAKTAAALRRALRMFLDTQLAAPGDPQWSSDGGGTEHVYETALTELEAIVRLEERGVEIPRPWSFFLEALEERNYVARGDSGAVAVYPYRVAAGIPAQVHCVIGLTQAATRVRSMPPLGVRQDELRAIGWEGNDRSRAFLTAYGSLQESTVLSCSDQGPSGAQVPAAELTVADEARSRTGVGPWHREEQWWRDEAAAPANELYLPQRRGLERALATTLVAPADDLRTEYVEPKLLQRLPLPHGYSPSMVDTYLQCPFSFFMRHILRVRQEEYGFVPDRPAVLGTVLHATLERVLRVPAGERTDAVRPVLSEEFVRAHIQFQVAPVGIAAQIDFAERALTTLLAEPRLEALRPGTTEAPVSGEIGGVPISGVVDRIAGIAHWDDVTGEFDEHPPAILDYKLTLRSHHTRKAVFGTDGGTPEESQSLQLPIYALLLSQNTGVPVERLAYVGLRSAEVKPLADPAAGGPGGRSAREGAEHLERMRESLPIFLRRMHEAVTGGDFRCREERGCSRCRIRSICRSCFVTRRYQHGA
ncbi:MAG: PD-(D/E)XK nuclease family protein [Alkalispirochaeta sp.]